MYKTAFRNQQHTRGGTPCANPFASTPADNLLYAQSEKMKAAVAKGKANKATSLSLRRFSWE
jgi:hypothetical protein